MKINDSAAGRHAQALPKEVHSVLVFGYDEAQIRNRVQQLTQQVCADVNDAFAVETLTPATLKDNEAALATAVLSPSLMGGKRVVRVLDATDKLTATLKDLLPKLPDADCLLILSAGELPKNSSLRLLYENHATYLGWICYKEEGAALQRVLQEALQAKGLTLPVPAQQYLLSAIDNERGLLAAEVEKLLLYAYPRTALTLEDVIASVASVMQSSIDAFCFAVLEKKRGAIQAEYDKAVFEGVNEIVLLRALQNFVGRLLQVKALQQEGKTLAIAMKILKPPVFFKVEQRFGKLVQECSEERLNTLLGLFLELEVTAKRGHGIGELLVQRALLRGA